MVGELSLQGAVNEIEVVGVKLQNTSFLGLLGPLVVAYCFLNLFETVAATTIYQDVHGGASVGSNRPAPAAWTASPIIA